MYNYLKIKNIRKYFTKEATKIFVLSLVISHLDYCNLILYGTAQCEKKQYATYLKHVCQIGTRPTEI